MSDNNQESGEKLAKPQLKSDMLAIKVDKLLQHLKHKRENDNKTMEMFELMVRQSFERLITAYHKEYQQTFADDSTVDERIARLESILEDIHKIEEMFIKMYTQFNALRAEIFGQTSEPTANNLLPKSKVLLNKIQALLKQWKNKRDSDEKRMAHFEKNIRLIIDRLIRAFKQDFLKTYANDEEVDKRLRRLEAILSDIKTIEDMFCRVISRFDAIRDQIFVVNSTS